MTRMTYTILCLSLAPVAAMAQDGETRGQLQLETGQGLLSDRLVGIGEAQDTIDDGPAANLIRTRDITGGAVYTVDGANETSEWTEETSFSEVHRDWVEIGEIEDVVLDREGRFDGIVAEVGGFLDMGDSHVYLPVEDVRLVPAGHEFYAFVTDASREDIAEMPDVDEGFWN